jgi:hypothetical protein
MRFVSAAAAPLILGATALAQDDAARSWSMDDANAARTSFVDVAPARVAPVERWRCRPDEGVFADAVTWGDVVFCMSRTSGGAHVVSGLDARNGQVLGRQVRRLRRGDDPRLAVWGAFVVIAEPDQIDAWRWTGQAFKPAWTYAQDAGTSVCTFQGLVFAAGAVRVLATGSEFVAPANAGPVVGPASVASLPGDRASVLRLDFGTHERYDGTWIRCAALELSRCSGGADCVKAGKEGPRVGVARLTQARLNPRLAAAVRLDGAGSDETGAWIIDAGAELTTATGKSSRLVVRVDQGENKPVPGVARPAVVAGTGYTFDAEGNLLAIRADASCAVVAKSADLPPGASQRRLAAARGVLYGTDWAFDVASSRVLWTRPLDEKSRVVGTQIPLWDGALLVRTPDGDLVCCADPTAAAPPAAKVAAPAAKSATPPVPTALPVAGDGVILRDGRQILGAAELYGVDQIRVTPTDEAPQVFALDEVLSAESAGTQLVLVGESDAYRMWTAALRRSVLPRVEEIVRAAFDAGLVTEAGKWLDRARSWGMPEPRIAEWKKKLATRTDPSIPEPKMRGLERKMEPLLEASRADVIAAAHWCGKRGRPVAGGALVGMLELLLRGKFAIDEAAKPVVPPSFLAKTGAPEAGIRWVQWARAMIAADAELVPDGDPAWRRVARAPWTSGTLAIRTPNLLLFTRCLSPEVVGPCLSRGEAAVRGLRRLLGVDEPKGTTTDVERLEVRLHRNRDDYLAEAGASGAVLAMTTGYFSPGENVSRFFVPAADAKSAESVDRGLFKTLAHELTHHYIVARWLPSIGAPSRPDDGEPGYWVVEGVARFMEDQIVDSDQRGLTFEDPSVLSVSLSVGARRTDSLFHTGELVNMSYQGFHRLDPAPLVKVELGKWIYTLNAMTMFYEQAGTLVFYLRNARGEEGRKALVEALRRYYTNRQTTGVWKGLGFETADALETAFTKWLDSLKR